MDSCCLLKDVIQWSKTFHRPHLFKVLPPLRDIPDPSHRISQILVSSFTLWGTVFWAVAVRITRINSLYLSKGNLSESVLSFHQESAQVVKHLYLLSSLISPRVWVLFWTIFIFIWCVWTFCLHVCIFTMYMQYTWGPEEYIGSLRSRTTDSSELLCEWVLEMELRTSGRVASAVNHWAISVAPESRFLMILLGWDNLL